MHLSLPGCRFLLQLLLQESLVILLSLPVSLFPLLLKESIRLQLSLPCCLLLLLMLKDSESLPVGPS